MYTFSSKLKTFSLILMAVGLLGIGYGFLSAPKDIQEVEAILASDAHGSHHEAEAEHTSAEVHAATEVTHDVATTEVKHDSIKTESSNEAAHSATEVKDSTKVPVFSEPVDASASVEKTHAE